MTRLLTALAALAPLLLLTGCSEPIDNPSGSCEADDDGARVCYHSPDRADTYLPDCEAPLDRDLWRVFAMDEDTAYMIPRPDAMGIQLGICDGDDANLAALFDGNGLCAEIGDPDLINAMTPADALAISHAMHERLAFDVVDHGDGSASLSPWAPDDELLHACEGPLSGDARVSGLCADLAAQGASGQCDDMARIHSLDEVTALAAGLNASFGIE
jgi:hypothetical protein